MEMVKVVQTVNELPAYMEEGSHGTHVNMVLAFLTGWAGAAGHGVICDGEYGKRGVALMKTFQKRNNLQVDGGFGPETRRCMKIKYGFDFDTVAREMPGQTVFIQPDGSRLGWIPPRAA